MPWLGLLLSRKDCSWGARDTEPGKKQNLRFWREQEAVPVRCVLEWAESSISDAACD